MSLDRYPVIHTPTPSVLRSQGGPSNQYGLLVRHFVLQLSTIALSTKSVGLEVDAALCDQVAGSRLQLAKD